MSGEKVIEVREVKSSDEKGRTYIWKTERHSLAGVTERGFGLSNLLGNIQKVEGDLMVYSNAAMLRFVGNSVQYKMLSNSIEGTLIKFLFNPNNLPEKGQEFDNEEFIF